MRNKTLTFALVALFALGSFGCAKLQARDNLNKGVRAFRDARFEAAINYFQEAMKLDPGLTEAELYLATAYAQQFIPGAVSEENQRHADMALQTFENVLRRDPTNVHALAGMASIYQNTYQLDKARDFYKKQAELDPTNPTPAYAVGSVNWLIIAGQRSTPPPREEQLVLIEEGLQSLDKALAINPDYEDAMSYKNLLYRAKADLSQDETEKTQLIAQADEWFDKAMETRKRLAEKRAVGGIVVGQ